MYKRVMPSWLLEDINTLLKAPHGTYIPQLLIIRRVINPGKQIIDSAVWGKFKISKQQLLRLWIPTTHKNAC